MRVQPFKSGGDGIFAAGVTSWAGAGECSGGSAGDSLGRQDVRAKAATSKIVARTHVVRGDGLMNALHVVLAIEGPVEELFQPLGVKKPVAVNNADDGDPVLANDLV